MGEILRASGPLGVLDARAASLSKVVQRVLLAPLLATAVAHYGSAIGGSGPALQQLAVVVRLVGSFFLRLTHLKHLMGQVGTGAGSTKTVTLEAKSGAASTTATAATTKAKTVCRPFYLINKNKQKS